MKIDMDQLKDETTPDLPSFNDSTAPSIPDEIIKGNSPLCAKVNSSFNLDIDKINYLLLHRRFKHASDKKGCIMRK